MSLELVAHLSWQHWALVVVAALLIGFAKTAVGPVAMVSVALFAMVLPTRESTGAVLLLLLVGDLVAVWFYRQDVDWRLIVRLIMPVAAGLAVGASVLAFVDDTVLRRVIGVILLALVVAGWWRDRIDARRAGVRAGYGVLAGFTTMVANAGGPPMSLYLLAAGYDKWRFLGTTAWFFLAVNLTKLPISIGLGIIHGGIVVLAATLAPVVVGGALAGRAVVRRLDQAWFERVVTVFVALTAVYLLI